MNSEPTYQERYRPQFHFTARSNWLNDPNGCVFHDGEYHLFFQHNPSGIQHGNMTWGHAVSADLVRWRQLPDAIRPYDGGTIFSGTVVVDAKNLSGLGRSGTQPLVAVFTHAREPFGQAIAFSNDHGRTWELHAERRHVVPNQGLDAGERDPKVFWHEPSRRWVMVLWVRLGQVRFFTSEDLLQWTHTSDFAGEGFYECPDLIPLQVDGDHQNTRWVLYDAAFRYWIGAFDGKAFVAEAGPFQGDYGANFYAAQTWNNTGARVIQIGWMRGGEYPGMPFNQQMSFPCVLSLRKMPDGIRLCRNPVQEIEQLRIGSDAISGHSLGAGDEVTVGMAGDLFDIEAEVETPPDASFAIRIQGQDIKYAVGRVECLGMSMPVSAQNGVIHLRALVDRTSLELFASQGLSCMSSCFLPTVKQTAVCFRAGTDSIRVRRLAVHRVDSTWEEIP